MPPQVGDMVIDTDKDFRVHTSVYTDPTIFDREMQRIFERTWVYVAHESEIPNGQGTSLIVTKKNEIDMEGLQIFGNTLKELGVLKGSVDVQRWTDMSYQKAAAASD